MKKPTVLIADDESHIRVMLRKLVTKLGYTVVGEAADGMQAVEVFKNKMPDIVLLDIIMPIKSGEIVLKEIVEYAPGTCVIMFSCISDEQTMKICMEFGAAGYIKKETPLSEVDGIIHRIWNTFNSLKYMAMEA